MYKFYSVVFTNKMGQEEEKFVIGTNDQVLAWAEKESFNYGLTYSVVYVTTDNLTGTIKNLCNY